MKTNKADLLAQNIKSTCKKLSDEMEEKPYVRPGQRKIWSLVDLNDLIENNKLNVKIVPIKPSELLSEDDDGFCDI